MVGPINLPLGPLVADGFTVKRSGIRWLVPVGHRCRAGEVVGFCNIGLQPHAGSRLDRPPFGEETQDFQVTFAPSQDGIVRQMSQASLGGFLDQHFFYQNWDQADVIATLETTVGDSDAMPAWRLGFAAGRRVAKLAEVRTGLLTGWHDRARAWHGEEAGHPTVVSLGICEQNGIFRGESNGFTEMLRESPGPLHVIQFTDEAFVPSAGVLLSQLERSAAANADIADDMTRGLLGGGGAPRPEDLIFAGAALSRLTQCPFFETHDLLTRQGLQTSPPIEAVVLSIHSEPVRLLRHRRLGYLTCWHGFRLSDAGPAVREWVEGSFEIVTRTLSDVQNDLMMLRKALAARGVRHMLILNAMSSTGHEDIFSYSAFQGPLGDVLGSVRAMETNLMLHDLAAASDIQIVDVDAIAAELGAGAHLPDGLHQSGRFQAAVRAEILHILDHRGLFKPADVDSPDDR